MLAAAPPSTPIDVGGSATINTDYTPQNLALWNGSIKFIIIPAGEFAASAILTPTKDFVIEGDETLAFTLVIHSPYDVGTQILAEMVIADLIDQVFKDSFENQNLE